MTWHDMVWNDMAGNDIVEYIDTEFSKCAHANTISAPSIFLKSPSSLQAPWWALERNLQVMVWNWLEYRMNLQHIGQAWTILDHPGPSWMDPLDIRMSRTAVEHLCPCRDVCLLWLQGAHVKKDTVAFFLLPQADDSPHASGGFDWNGYCEVLFTVTLWPAAPAGVENTYDWSLEVLVCSDFMDISMKCNKAMLEAVLAVDHMR